MVSTIKDLMEKTTYIFHTDHNKNMGNFSFCHALHLQDGISWTCSDKAHA